MYPSKGVAVWVIVAVAATACGDGGSARPGVSSISQPTALTTVEPSPTPAIPGLAAVDVYGNLKQRGFACDGPDRTATDGVAWMCRSTSLEGSAEYIVDILGSAPTAIFTVDANAISVDGSPLGQEAQDFLAFVATLPYEGAQPQVARNWVMTNFDKVTTGQPAETEIGHVQFTLGGTGTAKFIELHAPL